MASSKFRFLFTKSAAFCQKHLLEATSGIVDFKQKIKGKYHEVALDNFLKWEGVVSSSSMIMGSGLLYNVWETKGKTLPLLSNLEYSRKRKSIFFR